VSSAHGGFRFTIGQGMAIIAVLAVLFAILPMPLAINVAIATACLVAIGRNRLVAEPLGCVLCFVGLLVGVVALEGWFYSLWKPGGETPWGAFIIVSLLVGGMGAMLLRRSVPIGGAFAKFFDEAEAELDETEAELKLVENLLRQAEDDRDEVVILKLTAYRARLAQRLEELPRVL
jgi:hypothetical protein